MTLPRVGVGVVVMGDDGRVLMSLRRRPPEAGAWSILGGRVEPFERVEACARREVWEEAGVEVEIQRLLCITDHIVRDEGDHWVSPAYLARITSGVPTNREPEKIAAIDWFDLVALPARLTITARAAIRALEVAEPGIPPARLDPGVAPARLVQERDRQHVHGVLEEERPPITGRGRPGLGGVVAEKPRVDPPFTH